MQRRASLVAAAWLAAAGASGSPEPVQRLSCDSQGAGPTSLLVVGQVDARTTDTVSLEVSLASDSRGWPFLHYTAKVDPHTGLLSAIVPGLKPSTRYSLAARAHRRGFAEDMLNGTWSELSLAEGPCETTAAADEVPRASAAPSASGLRGPKMTKWLEVFRTTELNHPLPDFLDNHDAGDLGGDFAFLSVCNAHCPFLNFSGRVPVTRYCIEILDVSLPNVSSVTTTGLPVTSGFADYLSCNQAKNATSGDLADYVCKCDNLIDRVIAHQPLSQIEADCGKDPSPNRSYTCSCTAESTRLSHRYVGMMPVPLPLDVNTGKPGQYPRTVLPPVGQWYSLPLEGRCEHGEPVGTNGCTWQRHPLSHSIYTVDLKDHGWNSTSAFSTGKLQDEAETLQNIEVARKAFAALDLPSCGSDLPEHISASKPWRLVV